MSKKSATLKYVLKPGYTHYVREPDEADGLHGDVVKLEPGAVVDLNAAQAENFADRFELRRLHVERYTSMSLFASMLAVPQLFAS